MCRDDPEPYAHPPLGRIFREREAGMNSPKRTGLVAVLCVAVVACGLIVGCGDDDGGSTPRIITVADFEGHWDFASYKLTDPTIPLTVDFIANGASFDFNVADDGTFTGTGTVPGALIGLPNDLDLEFAGTFQLVTQDTASVIFDQEIPPFVTDFSGAFTLQGNTLTFRDDNETFDIDGDEVEEDVIFEGIMIRS
jgi:hypothetical protein